MADTAEGLAQIHSLDPDRTRLAALLHDAARETEPEDYLRLADEWGLAVGEPERKSPKLLHGPVAAELARRELGVEDEEVLEAVRVHTVGAAGIGALALALYVADKIEPARDYPSVGRIRDLGQRGPLRSRSRVAAARHRPQRGARQTIHPASREMLEWLEHTQNAAHRGI